MATALLRLAALTGVVALLLPGTAEARVLLSLDDFCAVGGNIADDTQVRTYMRQYTSTFLKLTSSDMTLSVWLCCPGSRGRMEGGLRRQQRLRRHHVPAGKSYQIWPVTLAGPCRDEIMLFVRPFHPSPPPRAFLLSAMHLRVSAHRVFGLCPGAMVQVSGNIIVPECLEDWDRSDGGKWLQFFQVEDLMVSGGDVIDGRVQEWWAQACKGKKHLNDKVQLLSLSKADEQMYYVCITQVMTGLFCRNRFSAALHSQDAPKALHFEECHGVRVQGVTLQNGQQHHLTFTRCTNARASFLRVASPESSPDTDGIRLVNSISVHINDIHIATGGACVSMAGNCTDVRLRYISCGPGNGISIGSIGETPVADRLEKIEVDTMFIANTTNGLLIKTWQDGCGYARKVKFANVVMKNVSDPIIIDQYRSEHPIPCGSTAKRAVTFSCSDVVPCRQVSLKDVNLKRLSGRGASAYCRSASGKAAGVVVPESCLAGARAAGDEDE
ncbi:hypothetical protein ZWY2020_058107 [Hordeum vulgare]|nr:hypothetical protein ZWY2020_058107 [Hordeum vulgare]